MKTKDRIKELRIKNGMTQSELGVVLGIGQKTVSMIEQGSSNPTLQQIERLTTFFNVSADYLLFGKQDAANIIESEILNVVRSDKSVFDAMVSLVNSRRHVHQLAM